VEQLRFTSAHGACKDCGHPFPGCTRPNFYVFSTQIPTREDVSVYQPTALITKLLNRFQLNFVLRFYTNLFLAERNFINTLDDLRIEVRFPARADISLLAIAPRPAPGPPSLLMQWIPVAPFPEVKLPGRDANHSLSLKVES
jgi:hypothetical protein